MPCCLCNLPDDSTQHFEHFCPVIHPSSDIITRTGGGWRRVFVENTNEIEFVVIFLSEAYYLSQARRRDTKSLKHCLTNRTWINTARAIITRAWSNWGRQGTQHALTEYRRVLARSWHHNLNLWTEPGETSTTTT
eukprot:14923937-Heterocapsa_arctica.AAC.1